MVLGVGGFLTYIVQKILNVPKWLKVTFLADNGEIIETSPENITEIRRLNAKGDINITNVIFQVDNTSSDYSKE